MIARPGEISVVRQCQLLDLSRSSTYYTLRVVSDADWALMRRLDELHLAHPLPRAVASLPGCWQRKAIASAGVT
jgi:putative transposase